MSSGDLPKHTFLSRVFRMAESSHEDPSDPLFTADNVGYDLEANQSVTRSIQSSDSDDSGLLVQSPNRTVTQDEDGMIASESDSDDDEAVPLNAHQQELRDQMRTEFEEDNLVDAVPESLLFEEYQQPQTFKQRLEQSVFKAERVLGPGLSQISEAARNVASRAAPLVQQHRRAMDSLGMSDANMPGTGGLSARVTLNPAERALWTWANITNLDRFLQDVYAYYTGNGLRCILASRICDLLIIVFVVYLSAFMGNCIDYNALLYENATSFDEARIPQCYAEISFGQKALYWILGITFLFRLRNLYWVYLDLKEIKLFYNYLLGVSDKELQTISWPTIVKKIIFLRDQNTNAVISGVPVVDDLKSKKRLNAHDIANRLMRRENYTIALFNRRVLSGPLKLPMLNTFFLTKTLEWNLNLVIFDFLFDDNGQLDKAVLSEHSRLALAENLRSRFKLAGLLSIFLTPLLVVYFLLYFFLRFFYELRTDPGLMSSREFSPHAHWKLREFNELPHIFDKRLKLAVKGSNDYLNQFPKELTNIALKFVSFITGSIVAVLAILTVFGHDNFLNFELTEGRTVLFYMSTLGAIFTICKSSIGDDNVVFEPEASLRYVAQFTHYLPKAWEGKYHTEAVRHEFCNLFNLKVVLVFKELASLILLPYLLYFRLPNSSERIVDFFREFTIHVDGLGYVCSFAMFNFEDNKDKPNSVYTGRKEDIKDYYASNDDKMAKSYMYFMESYGTEPVKKTTKLKSSTYTPSVKPQPLSQGIHRRGASLVSEDSPMEHLEETTAGLSQGTRNYINGLSNSAMLGDSFEATRTQDDDTGGVLGLLNQIYQHQDK